MKSIIERLRLSSVELVDLAAVFVLTVISLWALQSSYGGVRFLVLGGFFTLVALIVTHVGERYGLPMPATIFGVLFVYAVVGGAVALPHHTIAGLPSPASFVAASRSIVTGWKELITTAPPVGGTGDLMAVPVFAGMITASLGLLASRRLKTAAVALLAPIALLGTGIAAGTKEPVSVLMHGIVFAVVAIAWLSWREHERRPLLEGAKLPTRQAAMAGIVLLAAGAFGFIVGQRVTSIDAADRDIWRETVVPPFDPREYPSPLAGYRSYVNEARATESGEGPVMFTVEGLPEGVPVRLATMDSYDGLVWQVSAGDPAQPSLYDSASFERVGVSIEPEYEGEIAEVTVVIGEYNDIWVPDVGEVIELRFTGSAGGEERDRELADQYRYNRSTDTAASRVPLQEGDRYEMTVRLPVVVDDLAGEEIVPSVPRLGTTMSVPQIAQTLAGVELLSVDDTGQRLDLVRDQMVEYGTYSDGDRESGQILARPGHSAQRLVGFVQDFPRTPLIGNAEQYAATYALLFRDLGRVPTRVVMGFLPVESSIDGPVEVYSNQVEAWVELPLADAGWVAVFPTPPRDQTAISTSAPLQPEPDYRTQNPPSPPLIDPEFDQPATAAGEAQAQDEDDGSGEETTASSQPFFSPESVRIIRWGLIGASPFLFAGSGLGAVSLVKLRRQRKRRSEGLGHERMANGWRELVDYVIDSGRPLPMGATRRETAQMVGDGALVLARRADAAVWGVGEPDESTVEKYWDDVLAHVGKIAKGQGTLDRLKTRASLHSLKRAWALRNGERRERRRT